MDVLNKHAIKVVCAQTYYCVDSYDVFCVCTTGYKVE